MHRFTDPSNEERYRAAVNLARNGYSFEIVLFSTTELEPGVVSVRKTALIEGIESFGTPGGNVD